MERTTLDDTIRSVIAPADGAPGQFPGSFGQGKGIFGGLVFAAMVRAVEQHATEPLRTLSVDICAPVQPQVDSSLRVACVKRGRTASFWTIELTQEGVVVAHGIAFAGKPRSMELDGQWNPQPAMVPVEQLREMNFTTAFPAFLQHFDFRPAWGGLPGAGSAPESGGYIRLRQSPRAFDKAVIAACIDAWFPSFFVAADRFLIAGTVSFSVTFHNDGVAMGADDYAALCVQAQRMSDGYAVETNRLWSPAGELLAHGIQTIALLR